MFFFFFKQKTAYEMRISDWSSDVCSSDLWALRAAPIIATPACARWRCCRKREAVMSTRADMAPPAATKTKAKASTSTALDPRTRLWALVAAGACLLPLLRQLPPVLGAVIPARAVAPAAAPRRHQHGGAPW